MLQTLMHMATLYRILPAGLERRIGGSGCLLHSVGTDTWITGTHLKAKHGYLLLLLEGWVVIHRRIIGSDWPETSLK